MGSKTLFTSGIKLPRFYHYKAAPKSLLSHEVDKSQMSQYKDKTSGKHPSPRNNQQNAKTVGRR